MSAPLFRPLYQISSATAINMENSAIPMTSLEAPLSKTKHKDDAANTILEELLDKLSKTLDLDKVDLNSSKSMLAYGVDSLAAVEIRTWFKQMVAADVAIFEILSNISLKAMGMLAAKRSRYTCVELVEDREE